METYPLHNIAPPSGVKKKSNLRISSISPFPSFSSSYACFTTYFPPLQRNRGFLLTDLKPLCKWTHISSRERNPQWPNKLHSFPSFYRAYPEYFLFYSFMQKQCMCGWQRVRLHYSGKPRGCTSYHSDATQSYLRNRARLFQCIPHFCFTWLKSFCLSFIFLSVPCSLVLPSAFVWKEW